MKKLRISSLSIRKDEKFQNMVECLVDNGYYCERLTDDTDGVDFIANHIDGKRRLKVVLNGRAGFYKKYKGKQLFIAFQEGGETYLYPHDEVLQEWLDKGKIAGTDSWKDKGVYHYSSLNAELKSVLLPYKLS
jgi:hypothetical protein